VTLGHIHKFYIFKDTHTHRQLQESYICMHNKCVSQVIPRNKNEISELELRFHRMHGI
jgi:hypothetical protein